MEPSIYWKAVRALHKNRSHFAKLVKSIELTPTERSLLEARRLTADHRWQDAVAALSRVTPQERLLRAERDYLLAESLNRLGLNHQALEIVKNSVPVYREMEDLPGVFQGLLGVAVVLHVEGMVEDSYSLLGELAPLARTDLQRHLIQRERTLCEAKLGTLTDLSAVLSRLEAEKVEIPVRHRQISDQAIGYVLMLNGDHQASRDQFVKCIQTYSTLSSLNARFWSQLLTTVLDRKTTLNPADEIIRRSPVFFHRYSCARELQAGTPERAVRHWDALRNFSPQLYGEGFAFPQPWVEKTAFGKLVKRYRPTPSASAPAAPLVGTGAESLEERFIALLLREGRPIAKNKLIESLYGQGYEVSLDSRFYKLVERSKKRFPKVKILARAGAYSLE